MNIRDIHIGDGTVVIEAVAFPSSTLEALAKIAETVVDAAVKADVWSPVTFIKHEGPIRPSPIRRSPQVCRLRSQHPGPRHPVIVSIIVTPRPVTRSPDVTVSGADWLIVNRKRWRTEAD
jgi:hypothetical protein